MGDNSQVTTTPRAPKPDPVLMAASEHAREALTAAVDPAEVGPHEGAVVEGERLVTHFFTAASRGYVGWHWAVTLARAPRQKVVTVDEIVLLPGEGALTAPPWVPWKDRVDKGDLGPGDLVPVSGDDPRLVPGYLTGDEALDAQTAREVREVTRELGLGRERVLSVEGRDEAATRWFDGENGPESPIAQAAPARCLTCGFMVRLSGALATAFGVCANASSPSDGQVVAYDHGCGAHSDVRLPEQSKHQPAAATPVHDTLTSDAWIDADVEIIAT
ncbi:MAG: hypothetical protein QOK30_1649 [Nocardioidaceae bacterium]|jgi:hypothetical protein|nr:hypothetical protein [Nocardioidaceae bacterium]